MNSLDDLKSSLISQFGTPCSVIDLDIIESNIQRAQKMCTPRYLDIASKEINTLTDDDGTHIRVIAGDYRGYKGDRKSVV